MAVYLLHADSKLCHAQHYIGYTDRGSVARRVKQHNCGQGSSLTKAFHKAGITLVIAKVWPEGDRTFERTLKNKKCARRMCPICIKEKEIKGAT